MAETELARSGVRVLPRNQRTRFGEIDLVGRDRDGTRGELIEAS